MIARGVVRGTPLFRPRTVRSPLGPSGTPAANSGRVIGVNIVTQRGAPAARGSADLLAHSCGSFSRRIRSGCHTGDPQEGEDVTDARRGGAEAGGRTLSRRRTVRSSWPSRSGSARTSIATIRPPLTVRARTANGVPSGDQAMPPGVPLTRTRVAVSANRRNDIACLATAWAPRVTATRPGRAAPPSERTHDLGVEDGEESFEVAGARRRQEGVDDDPLAVEVDVGHGRALDAATGAARELPRRRRRPADDRRDLVERHGEHVVQHEGDPFGGRQRVEDDEHREPDRVAQQGFLLGIDPVLRTQDRIREVGLERRLAARPARPQHVEADATDDRRQPRPQVVDLARVGAAQADPGLLDGVVRLGQGAEHPKGDAAQVGAVGLEALGEPVLVVHASHSCGWSGDGLTREPVFM